MKTKKKVFSLIGVSTVLVIGAASATALISSNQDNKTIKNNVEKLSSKVNSAKLYSASLNQNDELNKLKKDSLNQINEREKEILNKFMDILVPFNKILNEHPDQKVYSDVMSLYKKVKQFYAPFKEKKLSWESLIMHAGDVPTLKMYISFIENQFGGLKMSFDWGTNGIKQKAEAILSKLQSRGDLSHLKTKTHDNVASRIKKADKIYSETMKSINDVLALKPTDQEDIKAINKMIDKLTEYHKPYKTKLPTWNMLISTAKDAMTLNVSFITIDSQLNNITNTLNYYVGYVKLQVESLHNKYSK
ncbi:MAG: hypothetical protein HRT99_03380 [Mycoplasmatales bacterium]|nr:hypothetical protein [Mycoplasmatales bacterium]